MVTVAPLIAEPLLVTVKVTLVGTPVVTDVGLTDMSNIGIAKVATLNVPLSTLAGIVLPLSSLSVVIESVSGLVCPAVPTALRTMFASITLPDSGVVENADICVTPVTLSMTLVTPPNAPAPTLSTTTTVRLYVILMVYAATLVMLFAIIGTITVSPVTLTVCDAIFIVVDVDAAHIVIDANISIVNTDISILFNLVIFFSFI
jgi:hypothetical protein